MKQYSTLPDLQNWNLTTRCSWESYQDTPYFGVGVVLLFSSGYNQYKPCWHDNVMNIMAINMKVWHGMLLKEEKWDQFCVWTKRPQRLTVKREIWTKVNYSHSMLCSLLNKVTNPGQNEGQKLPALHDL